MKPTYLLAGALALAAVSAPFAGARADYLNVMRAQYRLEKNQTVAKAACQYCHQNAYGGAPWNKFGDLLRQQYQGPAARKIDRALYLALKADKDSDGDGFEDALEVVAGTLPGDAKSRPAKTKMALEAELKRLGGVDRFKPQNAASPAPR